eukprot:409353_1
MNSVTDQRKYTVSGFIRESQSLLPSNDAYFTISNDIIFLCIFYYSVHHTFVKNCDEGFELQKSNRCIIKQNGDKHCSAFIYGIAKINSGVYKWRFRMGKCDNKDWEMIGIWKIDGCLIPKNELFTAKDSGYAFMPSRGCLISSNCPGRKYGTVCHTGDEIDMYFDSSKYILSYHINGKDYGNAFKVIKGNYKAAVGLFYCGESIELID